MRVLVIGASGFIGRYLMRRLDATPGLEVLGAFHSRPPGADPRRWFRVDLTDAGSLAELFRRARPDVVAHLAALADVGTAERNPDRATAVNATATAAIARLSESYRARLLFVSTEYVFDGRRGFYREDAPPNPATHYGRTKWEGERAVAKLASHWSILRTSIVYGWPQPGRRNFVPWLVDRLQRGEPYAASTETMRSPIYVEHLVEGIARLVDSYHPGTHHVAGRDWVSMYGLALAVADGFGPERELVRPAADTAGNPASRERLGLDCAKTMGALGLTHYRLAEGIAAMRAAGVDGRCC